MYFIVVGLMQNRLCSILHTPTPFVSYISYTSLEKGKEQGLYLPEKVVLEIDAGDFSFGDQRLNKRCVTLLKAMIEKVHISSLSKDWASRAEDYVS